MDETAVRILGDHLCVNDMKPVSYLPSKTITSVLGMSIASYERMAREKGLRSITLTESESCINSGAVYVYHQRSLEALLFQNRELLYKNGWPSDQGDFIRRVGSHWLREEDPVLPVIRLVFGDEKRCNKQRN